MASSAATFLMALVGRDRCGKRFALDDLRDRVEGFVDAAVVVVGAQLRRHVLANDPRGDGVGQCAFEAIAYFDANPAIVLGQEQKHSVIRSFASYLVGFGDLERISLEVFRLGRGHHQHHDLRALGLFEIDQPAVQLVDLLGGQRAREVGDVAGELGHDGIVCQRRERRRQQSDGKQQPRREPGHQRPAEEAGAGVLPKSTVGAVEIAFSFSTLKFGFTL